MPRSVRHRLRLRARRGRGRSHRVAATVARAAEFAVLVCCERKGSRQRDLSDLAWPPRRGGSDGSSRPPSLAHPPLGGSARTSIGAGSRDSPFTGWRWVSHQVALPSARSTRGATRETQDDAVCGKRTESSLCGYEVAEGRRPSTTALGSRACCTLGRLSLPVPAFDAVILKVARKSRRRRTVRR